MTNIIAKLGQNIQFVAFWAHLGVAGLVSVMLDITMPKYKRWVMVAIIILAGVKEFWYDARYETNPPQTFVDNFEDWIGWVAGAGIGMVLATLATLATVKCHGY